VCIVLQHSSLAVHRGATVTICRDHLHSDAARELAISGVPRDAGAGVDARRRGGRRSADRLDGPPWPGSELAALRNRGEWAGRNVERGSTGEAPVPRREQAVCCDDGGAFACGPLPPDTVLIVMPPPLIRGANTHAWREIAYPWFIAPPPLMESTGYCVSESSLRPAGVSAVTSRLSP
jgi:hypothetical protein